MRGDNKKRENVSTREFMKWDNYLNKEPTEALESIYEDITSYAKKITYWYWKSIGLKRFASTLIRVVAYVLLACGTLAQFYATTLNDAQCRLNITQAAIALFAIAGELSRKFLVLAFLAALVKECLLPLHQG